jgi:drug/metabolite transporter (DMT)-like permease
MTPPSRTRVLTAFLIIYVVWGSTYLAIRFGVETIPPFLMAGTRFIVAGIILYGWTRLRGAEKPSPQHWLSAVIVGGLMLLMGNGGVTWAEQQIPSGVAALLISTSPFWFVVLEWVWFGAARPSRRVMAGLGVGLVGTLLLIGPERILTGEGLQISGVVALLISTIAWASGSLYSRRAILPKTPLLATAMQMLAGGGLLLLLGLLTGEAGQLHVEMVSLRSVLALVYLTILGSLISFPVYIWLLRASTPTRVSTYAFVNPVIAVFLGWALGGEEITARIAVAAAVIVGAVVLIVVKPRKSRAALNGRPGIEGR